MYYRLFGLALLIVLTAYALKHELRHRTLSLGEIPTTLFLVFALPLLMLQLWLPDA